MELGAHDGTGGIPMAAGPKPTLDIYPTSSETCQTRCEDNSSAFLLRFINTSGTNFLTTYVSPPHLVGISSFLNPLLL